MSGGVSVGPYDVVKLAFEEIGRIDLWRVAVQPGKPFAFGTAERPDGGRTLLFGLPGNPVSSFVTFELFVRPGDPGARRPSARSPRSGRSTAAVLDEPVIEEPRPAGVPPGHRASATRAARRSATSAAASASGSRAAAGQGSHVLSALAAADALAVVPEAHDTLDAGADVELWWLDAG